MPELPEVETIRIGLEKYLVGKTIEDIEIRTSSIFHSDPRLVIGAEVIAVKRRGKGLLIDLSNGYTIAAHVKMTGQFIYKETKGTEEPETKNFHPKLTLPAELPHKHTHVVFTLSAKRSAQSVLYYNDIRKFGWIKVVKTEEVENIPFFKSLGRDPLSNLTIKQFSNLLRASNAPIKSVLMDQRKIAGVGNIYANEALFAAKINPRRSAKSLNSGEQKALYDSLLAVLTKGLSFGGASDNTYVNVDGGKGQFQQHFQVYRKNGTACPVCGTSLERSVIAGRGTFFCPVCQK